MKIERFEDTEGWNKARILTKLVYSFTRKDQFSKDYGFKDQITRASVSVMLNIAEGFDGEVTQNLRDFYLMLNEQRQKSGMASMLLSIMTISRRKNFTMLTIFQGRSADLLVA